MSFPHASPAWLVAALTLLTSSCAASAGGEPGDSATDLEAELCAHLASGPASDTLGAPRGGALADVSAPHRRYDVTLRPTAGGQGGAVALQSSAATGLVIGLSQAIPLAVFDAQDAAIPVTPSAGSSRCPEMLKSRVTVEVGVGTYALELGPAADTAVSLVIEEAAHDEATTE